jgi:hypothetical protein
MVFSASQFLRTWSDPINQSTCYSQITFLYLTVIMFIHCTHKSTVTKLITLQVSNGTACETAIHCTSLEVLYVEKNAGFNQIPYSIAKSI